MTDHTDADPESDSDPASDPDPDLDRYASLRARLAVDADGRAALLAQHGLDEATWDAVDDRWQARLSRELDAAGDDVPPSLLRYSEVFSATQRASLVRLLELEELARCARALGSARDPRVALEQLGVSLEQFLKANQHWAAEIARDPLLAERFRAAMSGTGGQGHGG